MNLIKRLLGPVWIFLALYVGYDRIVDSLEKIVSPNLDDRIFGWVVLLVLTPLIVSSLGLFGYYALRGEYDRAGKSA
jgi:hypothetical protein